MNPNLHLAPALASSPRAPSAKECIRVVLADDHALTRRSLRWLLNSEDGLEVIAELDDIASAMRHVEGHFPHVLILDLSMPNGSSIETIRWLRERAPGIQIVVLTMDDDPIFAQHALDAGAIGLVLKQMADTDLAKAVRSAARGEPQVSPRVAARLASMQPSLTEDELTPRETEVLRLIALGHTSVAIARQLHVSARTVETHRARIHRKLGLATRAEMVRVALRRGLLRV